MRNIFGVDVFGCHLGHRASCQSNAIPDSAAAVAVTGPAAVDGFGIVIHGSQMVPRFYEDPNHRMYANRGGVNFGNIRVQALHGAPMNVPRQRYFVGPVHAIGALPVSVPRQRYFVGPVHAIGSVSSTGGTGPHRALPVPRERFFGNVHIQQLGAGPDGLGNY